MGYNWDLQWQTDTLSGCQFTGASMITSAASVDPGIQPLTCTASGTMLDFSMPSGATTTLVFTSAAGSKAPQIITNVVLSGLSCLVQPSFSECSSASSSPGPSQLLPPAPSSDRQCSQLFCCNQAPILPPAPSLSYLQLAPELSLAQVALSACDPCWSFNQLQDMVVSKQPLP